ncbi:diguanylate cyclase domain-containing protein [Chromatocurvus halotolerans]|nr:diguanylate cyclase [Chromatocurvus halotolerans]
MTGSDPVPVAAVCPRCSGSLVRIRRRVVDHIICLFTPVWRYRCSGDNGNVDCRWQGNFHDRAPGSGVTYQTAFGDMSFGDMAQITLNAIGDAVLVADPGGKVIYMNRVAETLTGWKSAEALGKCVEDVFYIVDGNTRERMISPSKRAMHQDRIVELELGSILIRHDGTDLAIEDSAAPILNRLGQIVGAVIVFHDARESRTVTEMMSHHAQHDILTDLPNRLLLMERLTQAIGMASRSHKPIALLFLDLDHFKDINDTFGHAIGDHLLRDVAADIVSCVRATDTVSRLGGDEFVILLTQIEESRDADHVAKKLLERVARSRVVDGHRLRVTLSIGISHYPENGLDAGALMENADAAMYCSKSEGRNKFQVSPGHLAMPFPARATADSCRRTAPTVKT